MQSFLKKHKNKLITVGLSLGALALVKFVASKFSDVPVVGKAMGTAAKFL